MARFSDLLEDFFYRPDEDVAGLQALVEGSDGPDAAVPEENPEEFLAFLLEGECYAVPVATVRELVKVPPLTEIPRCEPHLLGVMYLRGEVVPVYDVKQRLRLADQAPLVAGPDAPPPPRSARIIVVRTLEGPAGIWVDTVSGVVRLKPSMLEPAPPGVGGGERDCVVGIGRRGPQLYILLDVPQALA
ncbi:chemotaxis protein CheW [Myxococcaceae bacterium GXIMD 01537]